MRNRWCRLPWKLLSFLLLLSVASVSYGYPLSSTQKERLRKFLPRTVYKLERQDPVHIVATGDSVTQMFSPNRNISADFRQSYAAVFASELAREFFYPGGFRVVNPLREHPAKTNNYLGAEIWIENLSTSGATSLDAMRRFTTEVFLNQPDLVTINYGINDAIRNLSLGNYRENLVRMIDLCRENGADVILFGPNPIAESDPPFPWGMTRPFTTVAAEVAEEKGILFVDLGQIVASQVGIIEEELNAESALDIVSQRLWSNFSHPDVTNEDQTEKLHPSPATQSVMGKGAFDILLNGETEVPYTAKSRIEYESDDTLVVTTLLRNQTDEDRSGHLAALQIGKQFVPESPFQSFELEAGKSVQMVFRYRRKAMKEFDGEIVYYPTEVSESNVRISFLITDEEGTRFVDEVRRLEPIGIIWLSEYMPEVTNGIPLEWSFVNGADQSVNGKYTIEVGGDKASENFTLPPLGAKKFYAKFPFSPKNSANRVKDLVTITVEVDGKSFSFRRQMEAVKDFVLGERVPLVQEENYRAKTGEFTDETSPGEPLVTVKADADDQFLFVTYEFSNLDLQPVDTGNSLIVDLHLDARSTPSQKQRGFVGKIRVSAPAVDGPGVTEHILPGAMGEGYAFNFLSDGVSTVLRRETPSSKRFEIRVPRSYLAYHEWELGSVDSYLGFNTTISFAEVDPSSGNPLFPPSRRYVHSRSELHYSDSWSFGRLRLSRAPVKTWSVRLY